MSDNDDPFFNPHPEYRAIYGEMRTAFESIHGEPPGTECRRVMRVMALAMAKQEAETARLLEEVGKSVRNHVDGVLAALLSDDAPAVYACGTPGTYGGCGRAGCKVCGHDEPDEEALTHDVAEGPFSLEGVEVKGSEDGTLEARVTLQGYVPWIQCKVDVKPTHAVCVKCNMANPHRDPTPDYICWECRS